MKPCPCCGYLVFDEVAGSYSICPICFWEDDAVQLLDPGFRGGANQPSLKESQENFQRYGAMEERFVGDVRPPALDDERDPTWRPVQSADLQHPLRPVDLKDHEWRDEVLYYWRRSTT